ncbi:HlyD family secretion protein [Bradyrhizobium sp. Arg314]
MPNRKEPAMGQHKKAFTIEKTVPASRTEIAQELILPTSQAPAATAGTLGKVRKWRLRRLFVAGAALAAIIGGAHIGWQYWIFGRFVVSTDDAYVKADSTTIAPKVSGYIADVLVDDNQAVRAGQVLARIDNRDLEISLGQAKAEVQAAEAAIANKQAVLAAQQSEIDAGQATIAVDQANEVFAEEDDNRYAELAKKGFGTVQHAQQAASRIAAARATVTRDKAALANANKHLDVIKAELAQAEAVLARAKAAQEQGELNLSYSTLFSPIEGRIGNRTVRIGQYVQAGTQLMAVVPTEGAYIIANYKETQLTNVHPGQSVEVEVDTFPGLVLRGHVDSVSPASGQEFALLPPDNATGNFTKVVQRIPVKIVLDRQSALSVALRPGMSVYPSIDTKSGRTEMALASEPTN